MMNTDLWWVAGLLEGEGSFLLKRAGGTTLVVQCAMTDLDIIERLAGLCGGSFYPVARQKAHHKDAWSWSLRGQPAYDLMRDLYPMMGQRRQGQIMRAAIGRAVAQERAALAQEVREVKGTEAGRAYLRGEGTLRDMERRFGVTHVTVKNYADRLRSAV
jgi:hypothetical protein